MVFRGGALDLGFKISSIQYLFRHEVSLHLLENIQRQFYKILQRLALAFTNSLLTAGQTQSC
jgi:hypothetical protein